MDAMDVEARKGMAILMGYNVETRWGIRWYIVYPDGDHSPPHFDKPEAAWGEVFYMAGLNNGYA